MSLPALIQPTFRTGANYVRVDMYATEDGTPVEDLKVDEIRPPRRRRRPEDRDLRARRRAPAVRRRSRLEPNTVAESREMAADARARVFVIFLDTYHTQLGSSARMRVPLTRFLDRHLGPTISSR